MQEKIIKLNNGVTLLYSKKESYFSYVSFCINAGSLIENRHQIGCAHLLEHMLFNGTQKHKKGEIEELIESCGGTTNAYTTEKRTVYHGSIMKENTELLTDLFLEMLFLPKLDEKDFEDEKNIVIQEMMDRKDDPWTNVFDVYDYKNFGQNPIIGFQDSITNMKYEDFIHFYKTFYNLENLIISISTPLSEKSIVDLLEKQLSNYDIHGYKNKNDVFLGEVERNVEEDSAGDEQSKLLIGFIPPVYNEDMFLLYIQILGGGMTSRLFKNIREEKKLCYNIFAYGDEIFDKNRITIGVSFGEFDKTEEICYNCIQEIDNMKNIEQEEFDRAKNAIIAQFCKTEENMERSASSLLYRYNNKLPLSVDERISSIKNITIDDFVVFVTKYLTNNHMYKLHTYDKKGS